MAHSDIPDSAIETVAQFINERHNKHYGIPVVGNQNNPETPQIFEILPFDKIDDTGRKFYAVDGSYNSEQFYNGLSIGMYTAGYICYCEGKQLRQNDLDDPVILGQAYLPQNILVANQTHLEAIYDELLRLPPVVRFLSFLQLPHDRIFAYTKEQICVNLSTLLGFCQEVLEFSLVYEISEKPETIAGDFILRDGTLRSLQIKQQALAHLGKHLYERGIVIVGVTKQSPIKMELAYTFKQIDNYLQDRLKPKYPFDQQDPRRQKLCCWFEVPDSVLIESYSGDMYARKNIRGGRGFGIFTAARLDYVEKLQNYDWLIVDVNIFDAIPQIEKGHLSRDRQKLQEIFLELTRLTQEHYILGYPYPLAEVHNFVTLRRDFKDVIISRVKYSLYKDQHMDNVDIENLFLDMHDRF